MIVLVGMDFVVSPQSLLVSARRVAANGHQCTRIQSATSYLRSLASINALRCADRRRTPGNKQNDDPCDSDEFRTERHAMPFQISNGQSIDAAR